MSALLSVTVLASGRGSNLEALLSAIEDGRCRARVGAVVSDRQKAEALARARSRDIPAIIVKPKDHPSRDAWDEALATAVAETEPDVVVFAGFMRIVGPAMLRRFGGRMINVHPSLLPAFTGIDAPAQAVTAGVRLSGCTVHLVDEGVDTGTILAQAAVPVHPDDDAASLHARIQRAEHRLLPAVVGWIADGALTLGPPPRFDATLFREGATLAVPEMEA